MTFGDKLKIARTGAGLTQAELAKGLNVTGNTISNWENNVSKPDLDTLAYICGILHVNASFFLQATLPEDEVSISEYRFIKKYRELDTHGKEIVDFILEKEHIRMNDTAPFVRDNVVEYTFSEHAAAHERTDIDVTEDMRKYDDDIMDDDNF